MLRSLLILLVISFCSFRLCPDATTDKLVMKAAESQLQVYIAKIQPGHEADYGFTDKDVIENCAVGKPYRLLGFHSDFFTAPLADNINYLVIKNEWRVPVTLNGEHRLLLTVDGNPGNFTVSGMGGAALAKELEYKTANYNDKNDYFILRIHQLSADILVIGQENSFADAEFIPMASAHKAIPAFGDSKKSFTLNEVQTYIKNALPANQDRKEPVKKKPAKKKVKK